MPQCWQIISLSRRRSKRGVERSPSSNLLTCYVGGHWRQGEWGERGRWLRVNIMHAWLPPDPTQHEQLDQWADPTDSALFEWINATHRPAPPIWMWIWILDSRFWIWISVVFGLRFTVNGLRVSLGSRFWPWQVYCLPRLRLLVMPFCVECFGHK